MSLGDFEILKSLGEGAYGWVYKVRRIQENKEYVMKIIKMPKGLTKKEKKNSINEVLAGFTASEGNSEIQTSFLDKNDLHIIMEYFENGDLLKLF